MTARLDTVLGLIDEANSADPTRTEAGGNTVAAELLYGQRMSAFLDQFMPEASEHLKIACRAQHLERWKLPRSDYPMTRAGYHAWRNEQKRRHGERVSELMAQAGYDEDDRARVASLVRKEGLKRDAETQTLEDVVCLVFLQYYAVDFAAGRETGQIIDIIRKTWRKMSADGQQAALALDLDPALASLANDALKD